MNAMPVPMKHIIWPMERSIPPDTMTSVMLMARMPVVDTCIMTLAMFLGLMNATLVMSKPRTKISSTRNDDGDRGQQGEEDRAVFASGIAPQCHVRQLL